MTAHDRNIATVRRCAQALDDAGYATDAATMRRGLDNDLLRDGVAEAYVADESKRVARRIATCAQLLAMRGIPTPMEES